MYNQGLNKSKKDALGLIFENKKIVDDVKRLIDLSQGKIL